VLATGALPAPQAAGAAVPAAAAYPKPLASQWWFTSWQVRELLWPVSRGRGVIVAVLDTGVEAKVRDLRGVVLPGADFANHGSDGRVDLDDKVPPGHGTAMASLIAGQGTGTGFLGVAPEAKILPINVHGDNPIEATVRGIRYAVDRGAKIINISQASPAPCPDELQRAVGYALEHQVIVVAAAGNTGDTSNNSEFPANCAGVVAVGAVGVQGSRFVAWAKTQRQPYVAVGAPGVGVSGVLKDGQVHSSNGGTSGATALASGILALARSRYPDMPARELVARLIASCLDVAPPGRDDRTGYGIIRPNRVLNGTARADGPNPVFDAYDAWKRAAAASASPAPAAQPASKSEERVILVAVIAFLGLVTVLAAVAARMAFARRRRRPDWPTPG
jgi:type VII secretion-associated serine protease mycosin